MQSWVATGSRAWLFASLMFFGCGSCAVFEGMNIKDEDIITERRPDPVYDELFPYYVDLCAASQFRPKFKALGGVPGHAAMYIKGACKDETAAYPRLRRCRHVATRADDPEHGVGVSVNRWFRNINWIAVPGTALFYAGNLEPGARLTREHFDATVLYAMETGVYDGVELHEFPTPEADQTVKDFIERWSLGTDFGLQFARSVFCARMPVTLTTGHK